MKTADILPRMYEDLANHFARQGESRRRDECLVLAADAALGIGQPEDADRLRKRLLLTNPHHLLRPYATMAEAMLSVDVCDYVADLRKQWPPETAAKLLNRPPVADPAVPPLEPERVTPKAKPPVSASPEPEPEETSAGYWLSMLMLTLGVAAAGGILLAALGGPLLD
jgi:hypothetical protein